MQHPATFMFRAYAKFKNCVSTRAKEQQCKIEHRTLARKRNVLPFLAFLSEI